MLGLSRTDLLELVHDELVRNPFLEEVPTLDVTAEEPQGYLPDVVINRLGASYLVTLNEDGLRLGLKYPQPLSLHAVSGDIGLPVSAITSVIANQYIETPRGVFDLTFFFDLRTGSA